MERCRRAVPVTAGGEEPSPDIPRVWHPELHAGQAHAYLRQRPNEGLANDKVPDVPAAWRMLRDAGVDLLNTDDLAGLARFLNSVH